jgi:hypothetical protein
LALTFVCLDPVTSDYRLQMSSPFPNMTYLVLCDVSHVSNKSVFHLLCASAYRVSSVRVEWLPLIVTECPV